MDTKSTTVEEGKSGIDNVGFEPSPGDSTIKKPVTNNVITSSQEGYPGYIGFEPSPGDGTINKPETNKGIPSKQEPSEDKKRQQWSNPVEFLLSCISLSVGLGNVWRFPTTAYENGGGAFLIPYLIVLIFIGKPLYFMELSLGQFSSRSCVKVWKMVPAVKGVGYGQMIACWSVVSYYVTLMGLTVFYFIHCFYATLPWTYCDESWADYRCYDASNYTSSNESTSEDPETQSTWTSESSVITSTLATEDPERQSSVEQFFYNYVLNYKDNIDDGIGYPDWRLTLCLLFSWCVICLTLIKGVQSSGKVAYFTALFPYVVLITLLIKGATLPGAVDGVLFFVTPQWDKLLDATVWYNAISQAFFSLSVGFGAIIMFGSYNEFNHNIYRDAIIISLADTFTSLLAGLTVFSILGSLAYELDTTVDKVVQGGTGLAFISYPDAVAKFEWAPQLFAVLFFLMLFTLGLGSASGLAGCVISCICDQFPEMNKSLVTVAVSVAGFLCGLIYVTPGGLWILDLVDFFGGGFIIYILVIVELVAVNWIYGTRSFVKDIKSMLNKEVGIYWKFCWFFFDPVALFGILIYFLIGLKIPPGYPESAYASGWALFGFAVAMLPLCCCHAIYMDGGTTFKEKFWSVFRPKPSWGPKKPVDRESWSTMKNEKSTQL